jgi:hypothetical protein
VSKRILKLEEYCLIHKPGTSLALVYGTLLPGQNEDTDAKITTSCLLDGKETQSFGQSEDPLGLIKVDNNEIFCRIDQQIFRNEPLSSGEHEVLFQITSLSKGARFYFDYIVYEPLPDASVNGDVLQIGNQEVEYLSGMPLQDSHFTLGTGWNFTTDLTTMTTTPGSSVTLKFNGSYVQPRSLKTPQS